jgi:hypothetical protein
MQLERFRQQNCLDDVADHGCVYGDCPSVDMNALYVAAELMDI